MSWQLICSALLLACNAALQAQTQGSCGDAAFLGFDSRLSVKFAGRLPDGSRNAVAFELVAGKPVVALASELIGVSPTEAVRIPVPFPVTGLVSDGSSKLVVTAADGIHEMTPSGWSPSARFPAALGPSLHNSGSPLPLVTVSESNTTGFLAWRSMDSSLPIARIAGQLRAVSWNTEGLAAVVGNSLVTWKAGADTLRTLRTDPALAEARDLCFLDESRAVVSTKRAVYLMSGENALMVLAIPARFRLSGGTIYALDETDGAVWVVKLAEHMGEKAADRAYAAKLLVGLPAQHLKDPRYLEAVRILGCQDANRILSTGRAGKNK